MQELPETYTTKQEKNGNDSHTFNFGEELVFKYNMKGNQVNGFSVVCLEDSACIDFIGLCLCGALSVLPDEGASIGMGALMDFYKARSGKETGYEYTTHSAYELFRMDNGRYAMILALVD